MVHDSCTPKKVILRVKDELRKYLSGQQNAVCDQFIISREKTGGCEYVHVSHPELAEPLYQFWVGKKNKASGTPRHTGGKKPYVMLMIQELTELIVQGTPAHCVGHLICLVPYVEWGTGRLVIGREKQSMRVDDIGKVFGCKRRWTLHILGNLKRNGLLTCGGGSYFIPRDLIKKGGGKSENQV